MKFVVGSFDQKYFFAINSLHAYGISVKMKKVLDIMRKKQTNKEKISKRN